MRYLLVFAAALSLARAQDGKGVAAPWDIAKTHEAIAAHVRRLMPLLDQIQPKDWIQKGAPDTYVRQWESSRAQAKAIVDTAGQLARAPERLSGELEFFFRLQGLQNSVNALAEGIRRYQNPSLAALLTAVMSENGNNRERLQQYIVDLAAEKEQECQIADREAQRCRGIIAKEPPPAASGKKK